MKCSLRFLLFLFLACAALSAQQPDFHVRLFSVHDTRSITLTPSQNARISLCATCPTRPFTSEITLKGLQSRVTTLATRSAQIVIVGRTRIRSADGYVRESIYPLAISSQSGILKIIASIPLEEYAAEAMQGETAGLMPAEALKAMAVVVRSYATSQRSRHVVDDFELCDSTHCQNLRAEISPSVRTAVAATKGQLLWSTGVPATAFYHKDCGGQIENVTDVWPDIRANYLTAHPDPYCVRTEKSWTSVLTKSQIMNALAESGVSIPDGWNHIVVQSRTKTGRARTLQFSSGAGEGTLVSASTLRTAVGRALGWQTLKSDFYEIQQAANTFRFEGRGVGHGVGLCQTGAAEMASEGKSYREILNFYFPGTVVGVSAQGIPWVRHAETGLTILTTKEVPAEEIFAQAESALSQATILTGITPARPFEVRVYPSLSMFRDATGEPGWVAASTRGKVIETQPLSLLDRSGGARQILQHEFAHALLESVAAPNTPMWFREGLALYLSGESSGTSACTLTLSEIDGAMQIRSSATSMQRAYAVADSRVAALARRFGREKLLLWLRNGLPADIRSGAGIGCYEAPQHSGNGQPTQNN
jgi:stage II sporulation protein D